MKKQSVGLFVIAVLVGGGIGWFGGWVTAPMLDNPQPSFGIGAGPVLTASAAFDAHAQKDETKKADLTKSGADEAGAFADMLAEGIINDNPDMYQ